MREATLQAVPESVHCRTTPVLVPAYKALGAFTASERRLKVPEGRGREDQEAPFHTRAVLESPTATASVAESAKHPWGCLQACVS